VGWLVFLSSPVWGALVAGLVLRFISALWLVRISTGAIVIQVGLTLTSWLLLTTAPQETNWSGPVGATCPDLDGSYGFLLGAAAFSSLAVGAVAAASSIVSVHRRAARAEQVIAGLGASALSFAIFFPLLAAALCGFN
jgi:hypothetical protein